MSITVNEKGKNWEAFFEQERRKYPHFMKDWFDNDGEISGSNNLRAWRWEVNRYLIDRRNFLSSLENTQIPKPPTATQQAPKPSTSSNPTDQKKGAVPVSKGKVKPALGSEFTSARKSKKKNMPKPTKRSRAWKRSGRKRRVVNKALASVRVPFKKVIEVNSASSSAETGHWHNHLTIKELAGPALTVYEEFKCCSMKVRYIPEDITTGSGLYAACLLDQNGFGDPAKATTVWFPRVADLPGARLCHITRGCAFSWCPTEPDSRNYRKSYNESDTVVASFYIFGNSASLSIKGQLLITGLLRARGEYYAANIASRIKELSLINEPNEAAQDPDDSASDELKSLDD